jgi:hypothetical protein
MLRTLPAPFDADPGKRALRTALLQFAYLGLIVVIIIASPQAPRLRIDDNLASLSVLRSDSLEIPALANNLHI